MLKAIESFAFRKVSGTSTNEVLEKLLLQQTVKEIKTKLAANALRQPKPLEI